MNRFCEKNDAIYIVVVKKKIFGDCIIRWLGAEKGVVSGLLIRRAGWCYVVSSALDNADLS